MYERHAGSRRWTENTSTQKITDLSLVERVSSPSDALSLLKSLWCVGTLDMPEGSIDGLGPDDAMESSRGPAPTAACVLKRAVGVSRASAGESAGTTRVGNRDVPVRVRDVLPTPRTGDGGEAAPDSSTAPALAAAALPPAAAC